MSSTTENPNAKYAVFLQNASERAMSLFSYMDKHASPVVFLVSETEREAKAESGAEQVSQSLKEFDFDIIAPKDFWISKDDFADFGKTFQKISSDKPSRRISDMPSSYTSLDSPFANMREAILRTVVASPKKPQNLKFFTSEASVSTGRNIFVVLGVDEDVLSGYPSLDAQSDAGDFLSTSFIISLIDEFLEKHRIELDMPPDATETGGFHFGLDSILYQAGRNFVGDIVYRVSGKPQSLWKERLFTICTQISRTSYELGEAVGTIVLAPQNAMARSIEFSGMPRLGNVRSTRKLLELTKDGMVLHSDTEIVLGLAKLPRRMPKNAKSFFIDFLGMHKWRIRYGSKSLIDVSYGMPVPPRSTYDGGEFAAAIKKVFSFKGSRKVDRLIELIQAAMREKKGTMLVISKRAKEEARRLASQSTAVAPILLSRQLLSSLTPIDGAILLDPNGVCYSIGTILDGMATSSGDATRGARYNSAVKYVDYRKTLGEVCMAVVISEDGNVDLVA